MPVFARARPSSSPPAVAIALAGRPFIATATPSSTILPESGSLLATAVPLAGRLEKRALPL